VEDVDVNIGPLSLDHADYDVHADVLYLHIGTP
jgi:hypothetical protein